MISKQKLARVLNSNPRPTKKKKKKKKKMECLAIKHEALRSNASTVKKKIIKQ
jgi:hypothetical protein